MYVSSLLKGHAVRRKNSLYCPQGKGHASHLCHLTPRPFKSDYTSRFVQSRRASILVLESIRNRQAECHLESRVISADDSCTLPFFKEFLQSIQLQRGLRLNLAHKHPITPISPCQLDQSIKDNVPFWRVWCVRLAVLSVRRLLPNFNGGHRASI